jgi:hypothetical protein
VIRLTSSKLELVKNRKRAKFKFGRQWGGGGALSTEPVLRGIGRTGSIFVVVRLTERLEPEGDSEPTSISTRGVVKHENDD